nr:hypothetical protein [Mycobacterium gordonae]
MAATRASGFAALAIAAGLMAATRAPGFAALAIAAGSDGGDPRARLRRACDRR